MEKEISFQCVFSEEDPDMQFLQPLCRGTARLKEVEITNIALPKIYANMPKTVFFDRKDEQRALDWQPYIVIGTRKMFSFHGYLKAPNGIVVYGSQVFDALKEKIVTGRLRAKRYHRKHTLKLFLLEVPEDLFNYCLENDYRDSECYFKMVFQLMRHCKESYWKSCEADILQMVHSCVYRCQEADERMINFRLNEKLELDHVGKAAFEPRDAFLLLACQDNGIVDEVIKYARINEEYVNRLSTEEFYDMKEYPWVVPPFARLIRRYIPVDIITAFKIFNKRLHPDDPYGTIKELIRDAREKRENAIASLPNDVIPANESIITTDTNP